MDNNIQIDLPNASQELTVSPVPKTVDDYQLCLYQKLSGRAEDFERDLREVINRYSVDADIETADYILAELVVDFLDTLHNMNNMKRIEELKNATTKTISNS